MPSHGKLIEKTDFEGERFLMDAFDKRQYMVRFEDGQPQGPVIVCSPDGKEETLEPNATVIAFHGYNIEMGPAGPQVSTTLVEIGTDEYGQITKAKTAPCQYDIHFTAHDEKLYVWHRLSDWSAGQIAARGFNSRVPKTYTTEYNDRRDDHHRQTRTVPPYLFHAPFPPQHPLGTLGLMIQKTPMTVDRKPSRAPWTP